MLPFVGEAIRPFTTWDRDTGRPLQMFNILIRPHYDGNKQAAGANARGKYRRQTQGAKAFYFKTGCICAKSRVMRKSFSWNIKSTLECLCRSLSTELIRTFGGLILGQTLSPVPIPDETKKGQKLVFSWPVMKHVKACFCSNQRAKIALTEERTSVLP